MIKSEAQSQCCRRPAEGALDSENKGKPLEEVASKQPGDSSLLQSYKAMLPVAIDCAFSLVSFREQ